MDGVVADTTSLDFKVWQRIFKEAGKQLSFEGYKSFVGQKASEIMKTLVKPGLGDKEAQELGIKKERRFIDDLKNTELKPMPGLNPLLAELAGKGYKIALATAATREKAVAILGKLGMEKYFRTIITADDASK